MENTAFWLYDGGEWLRFFTYDKAEEAAEISIEVCRDHCDPEWPASVEDIAIYHAPFFTDSPDEDGVCVSKSTIVNETPAEEGDSVHFWCDYAMRPIPGDPT